jgi:predicted MFS family arabinose efflux permease
MYLVIQFGAFDYNDFVTSAEPFNFNSATIGLFGIVGASRSVSQLLVGKLGDKGSSRAAVGYGCALIALSFIVFTSSGASVAGIVIEIVPIDTVLKVHFKSKHEFYLIVPEARNEMNTVLCLALGTAAGSAISICFGN